MTITTNKVFVDSSILIELEKGNSRDFLQNLYFDPSNALCIKDVVISEFLFHFISLQSSKAPLSIKKRVLLQS